MTYQLYTLTTGWRGYLVGPRRVWHPYHYFALAGYRSGWLLARPSAQTTQLVRAAALLESIFTRGGRAWGFGIGFHQGPTVWGQSWPDWLPGQITNCVYYRARQEFILQEARSGLGLYRLNRARTQRVRLDRGGAVLWGSAPQRQTRLLVQEAYPLVLSVEQPSDDNDEDIDHPLYGRPHRGWSATVKARFLRLITKGPLNRVARRSARAPQVHGRTARTTPAVAIVGGLMKLADRRARVIHQGRPRRRRPQAERPFRPARQYQTQPFGFPSVVIAAGSGTNRGLLSEAANFGVPAVYFAPAGFSPGLTPFGVVWGNHRRQPFGVSTVVALVYRHVWSTMLVQTVWARLR